MKASNSGGVEVWRCEIVGMWSMEAYFRGYLYNHG